MKRMSLNIPDPLWAQLDHLAQVMDTTATSVVCDALKEYFAKQPTLAFSLLKNADTDNSLKRSIK